MERFKQIPSKIAHQIKADKSLGKDYENYLTQTKEHNDKLIKNKEYIKRNMRQVMQINHTMQSVIKEQDRVKEQKKQKEINNKTAQQGEKYALPKYLRDLKKKQEAELKEIEQNKRPPGTRILDDQEKIDLLNQLKQREQDLMNVIERSSVTHFTQRAKNQYRALTMVRQVRDSDDLNSLCADCELPIQLDQSPSKKSQVKTHISRVEWVCTIFGVFLCAECAGLHRKLGRDLSEIKSIRMISPYQSQMWSERELKALTVTNGNVGFRDFLLPYCQNDEDFIGLRKYRTKAAFLYLHDISRKLKLGSGIRSSELILNQNGLMNIQEGNQVMFEQAPDDDRISGFEDSKTETIELFCDQDTKSPNQIRKIQCLIIEPSQYNEQNSDEERADFARYKQLSEVLPQPAENIYLNQGKQPVIQESGQPFLNQFIPDTTRKIESIIDKSVEGFKKIEIKDIKDIEKTMVSKGREFFKKLF